MLLITIPLLLFMYCCTLHRLFTPIKHSPTNISSCTRMNTIYLNVLRALEIIIRQHFLQTEINPRLPLFSSMILFETKRCMYSIFFKETSLDQGVYPQLFSCLFVFFLRFFQLLISTLCIFDNELTAEIDSCG